MFVEAAVGAILESVVSVGSEVGIARLRGRKTSPPPWEDSAAQSKLTQAIGRGLSTTLLPTHVLVKLDSFLSAPEGRLAARYIAAFAVLPTERATTGRILDDLHALLTFYDGTRSLAGKTLIAQQLVNALVPACRLHYQSIRREEPSLASEILAAAAAEATQWTTVELRPWSSEMMGMSSGASHQPAALASTMLKYCAALAESTSTLSIPSLTAERIVPLEDVFVHPPVTTSLDGFSASGNHGVTAILEALPRAPRIVLLGEPGGGKSTLIRASVHRLAVIHTRTEGSAPVPFLIRLSDYWRTIGEKSNLTEMLAYACRTVISATGTQLSVDGLRYLLCVGHAVVFFDGLDEILGLRDRGHVRDTIEQFVRTYRASSYVITSRSAGYQEAPLNPSRFAVMSLQRFSDKNVQTYVENFLTVREAAPDGTADWQPDGFIYETRQILDLRSNPLMLGLLCLLYDTGRSIPRSQEELYRSCASLLFSKWDARRGIHVDVADAQDAEEAIGYVAKAQFQNGGEEFGSTWLEEQLIDFYSSEKSRSPQAAESFAAEVIDLWRGRKWLLVRIGQREGQDVYQFSHRTFLEYFAAQRTAFVKATSADLWATLEPLVLRRAASVYALLSLQIFARHGAGRGEELFGLISSAIGLHNGVARQNLLAFLGELLPLMRSGPEAREGAVGALITGMLSEVTYDTEPRPMSIAQGEGVVDDEEEGLPLSAQFARTCLPLASCSAVGGELWQTISHAAELALARASGHEMFTSNDLVQFTSQLPALVHSPIWASLPSATLARFEEWAVVVRTSLYAAEDFAAVDSFWPLLYTLRQGHDVIERIAERHGPRSLLIGGWSFEVENLGLEPCALSWYIGSLIARTPARESLAAVGAQLERLGRHLTAIIHSGAQGDRFQFVQWTPEVGSNCATSLWCSDLSQRARQSLVHAIWILGRNREWWLIDALEASEDPIARDIGTAAGVARYTGDLDGAREALLRVLNTDDEAFVETETLFGLD